MLSVNLQHYTGKEVKKDHEYEALFRKFIDNQCSPAEVERVLDSLKTSESAKTIYILIAQELQQTALSNERIDPKISEEMRRKILAHIGEQPATLSGAGIQRIRRPPAYRKIAAIVTGLFILGGIAYRLFIYNPLITHSTRYGEMATIFLPDSSKVTLNGNSGITYAARWDKGSPREVSIKGEAFFQVRHTPDGSKFTVNTSHDLNVEVLGTKFSVYDRERSSRVVLNSGKVQLNIGEEGKASQVIMQPGDLVELKGEDGSFEKRQVDPRLYSSWVNKKIILDNTSFREIKMLLEDTYGLPVAVHDTSLYSERFSGTVPSENVEVLLNALAISFDLAIEIKNNQVLFKPKR